MVLDDEVIEVRSTGLEEFHKIPVRTVCYKTASGMGLGQEPEARGMASILCGACPQINQCTPDGIIPTKACKYYQECLDIGI